MTVAEHRLILLRHARAEHGASTSDAERPLTIDGRRSAAGVGSSLGRNALSPDLVVSSTALRTRQTTERVLHGLTGELGLSQNPPVEYSDELYGASPTGFLDVLRALPDTAATVLIVGHEPTLSAVAGYLARRPESTGGDAGTGAAAVAGLDPTAALSLLGSGMPVASYAVFDGPAAWAELDRASCDLLGLVLPADA